MSDRLQAVAAGSDARTVGRFGKWIAGRARRREYWRWAVPWFMAVATVSVLAPGFETILGPVMLCIWIRRLHDLGWTGWLAPVINIAVGVLGWIETGVASAGGEDSILQALASLAALVVLGSLPGQRHANAYGPPPGRAGAAETFS